MFQMTQLKHILGLLRRYLNASGFNASGLNASGLNASGLNASGFNASGFNQTRMDTVSD